MTNRKAFSQLEGVSPYVAWCILTTPSNPLENAKEWCRPVPAASSAGGKSENWEGRSGKPWCPGQHQHSLRDFCYGL